MNKLEKQISDLTAKIQKLEDSKLIEYLSNEVATVNDYDFLQKK